MKKTLKFILSSLSAIIVLMVALPIVLSVVLQMSVVQNFAVNRVTKLLSEKAQTTMSISKIGISFFSKINIEDAYIEDHRGDTLIYAKNILVKIDGINFLTGKISLGSVDLTDGQCNIYTDSTETTNIQRVFDHFKSTNPKKKQINFRMDAREVNLNNFHFRLDDYSVVPQKYGINFKDLDMSKIYMQVRDLAIVNDDIKMRMEHLTFRDRSGFYLQQFSAPVCAVNGTGMRFENLRIENRQSLLHFDHVYLLYDNWFAYNDFVNKVTLDVDIKPSRLSYRTLSFFMKQRDAIHTTVELCGRVKGAIPNLRGSFDYITMGNTTFSTKFSAVGLPDINHTQFKLAINDLKTNAVDVNDLYEEFTGKKLEGEAATILERSGNLAINGEFEGLLSDFHAKASIDTYQGTLLASLNVIPTPGENVTKMKGKLATQGFNLGDVLGVKTLGNIIVDANVEIDAGRNGTSMVAKANIPKFVFSGYEYNNISIDGRFEGTTYEGLITLDDANCKFEATGFFDLAKQIPEYDFMMDLDFANLNELGVNQRDSISVVSAKFVSSGSGNNLDNLNGKTVIERLVYVNHVDTISTGAITILSENNDEFKSTKLLSSFADINFEGTNSYSEIINYLPQIMKKYVPSFPEAEALMSGMYLNTETSKKTAKNHVFAQGSYDIDIDVKRANNVASIFVPGLQLATGTRLQFHLNPQNDKFNLILESEFIGTEDYYGYKISLASFNRADSILFRMTVDECVTGSIYMPNMQLWGDVKNNMVKANMKFHNSEDGSMADIKTTTSIYRTTENLPQIKVALGHSVTVLNKTKWELAPSYALIDSTGIEVHDFHIRGGDKHLMASGRLGRKLSDELVVDIKDMDISSLSAFTRGVGYRVEGMINGQARGYALLGNLAFDAKLQLDSLSVNDHALGNPTIISAWDRPLRRANFEIIDENNYTPVKGYYDLPRKAYRVDLKFPKLNMVLIEPLLQGILIGTGGEASTDLTLSGGGASLPDLSGTIDVKQYDFTVDYTKAKYSVKGMVDVKNSCFIGDKLLLTDNLSGTGTVDLSLTSKFFKNIALELDVKFKDFLVLNTTIKDNDVFYGRAFGTGTLKVVNNALITSLVAAAETAMASEFYLPFTEITSIEEASFITFADHQNKSSVETDPRRLFGQKMSSSKKSAYSSELDIKIDLIVKQNTKAQINMVTGYRDSDLMGNTIEGRGDGRLNMHINPDQGIFTMTGNYAINRGKYILNFVNIFDKELTISPNSSVSWTGNPADPEFNVDAYYPVKTSLTPLTGNEKSGNVSLNCGIKLTGKMSNPVTQFNINAISADPEKQSVLRNALNSQETINSQFFSLFLSGAFMPEAGMGAMGSSIASATGFEFLSNQLSNLISSDNYYLHVGFKPYTAFTSDEINFNFATEIIPSKLMFDVGGSYNMRNNPIFNDIAPFSGNASMTWLMNRSGTLSLKGFTRVIERFDEMQGLQETGIGLGFRQDFQTATELRQSWKDWLRRRNDKRESKVELKEKDL